MRVYYGGVGGVGGAGGLVEHEVGVVQPHGHSLTLDARDSHAWMVRTWGGTTLLELPESAARVSSTIDILECALRPTARQLHHGWR